MPEELNNEHLLKFQSAYQDLDALMFEVCGRQPGPPYNHLVELTQRLLRLTEEYVVRELSDPVDVEKNLLKIRPPKPPR